MMLSEQDLRKPPLSLQKLGEIKRLSAVIEQLQRAYEPTTKQRRKLGRTDSVGSREDWRSNLSLNPKNEGLKLFVSFLYALTAMIVTSVAMTVAHDRVPDMKTSPPLPDIFLDNIPTIPRAFEAAEACAISLTVTFVTLCLIHKHRLIIIRSVVNFLHLSFAIGT